MVARNFKVQNTRLEQIAERRRLSRDTVMLSGTILRDGIMSEKCIIVDFSRHGAQVARYFSDPIPNVFELSISDEIIVVARIVWTQDSRIGVVFEF